MRPPLPPAVALGALLTALAVGRGQPPLFAPEPPAALPAAVQALGAGGIPGTGAWSTLAGTLAGALPEVAAWDLRGPLAGRYERQTAGAQALLLSGFAPIRDLPSVLGVLGLLQAGDDGQPDSLRLWSLLDTDQVRPFPAAFKEPGIIRDGRDISIGLPETTAYSRIVVMAHYTSPAAFRRAARHDLTYAQIFAEPRLYRGEVIHIDGRLKRLARLEPPLEARAQGVSDLYEAWIFNDAYGTNPFCALFTELPASLRPLVGEKKIQGFVEVSMDGYFYKKFRYKAADSRERTARDAPVFIGRTLTVLSLPPPPDPAAQDGSGQVLTLFLGIIAGTVVVVVALAWWFRRNDERLRRRLRAGRPQEFIPPPADTGLGDFSGPAR
jgi:hypothetical protein